MPLGLCLNTGHRIFKAMVHHTHTQCNLKLIFVFLIRVDWWGEGGREGGGGGGTYLEGRCRCVNRRHSDKTRLDRYTTTVSSLIAKEQI